MLTHALAFIMLSGSPAAATEKAPEKVDKDVVICKTAIATGSRLRREKKCARKSEIEADRIATQKAIEDQRLSVGTRYNGNN